MSNIIRRAIMEELKGQIIVYSIIGCPHCIAAKSKLKDLKLPYIDVSVDRFPPAVRQWLKDRVGKSSVPQIFFNSKLIGGNEEFQKLVADDARFQEELRELRENEPPAGADAPMLPHPGEATDIPSMDGEPVTMRCEIDEYAHLIAEMRKAGIVKTHRLGVLCFAKVIHDSFSGRDFVDWAVDKKRISRDKAIFMGKQLVSRRFGVGVEEETDFEDSSSSVYKLGTSDSSRALNSFQLSECVQRPASDVAEDLRKLILKLYSKFISEDGRSVDYEGIATSKYFEAYKKMTLELQRVNIRKLSKAERIAFFVNVYNALVIHGNVAKGTPHNIWQRYRFFSTVAYNMGGHVYSLNDIENGILRANRGSMATLYLKPFSGDKDPRLRMALEQPEPRIHFALNCGARSCPPIKTFSGDNLEEELSTATQAYLETDEALQIHIPLSLDKTLKPKSPPPRSSVAESEETSKKEDVSVASKASEDASKSGEPKENGVAKEGQTSPEKAKSEEEVATAKEEEDEFKPAVIKLSMLFKWYEKDFGDNKAALLKWIHDQMPEGNPKKEDLARILKSCSSIEELDDLTKIKYIEYDWGNNADDSKKAKKKDKSKASSDTNGQVDVGE